MAVTDRHHESKTCGSASNKTLIGGHVSRSISFFRQYSFSGCTCDAPLQGALYVRFYSVSKRLGGAIVLGVGAEGGRASNR